MNFEVVRTIRNKCRRCYNCVRFCPAKAIKVEAGQAVVIPERCIGCGNCVKVCTQNAKEIYSSIEYVRQLLESDQTVIAIVAPSFPGELDDAISPGQLVAAYRKMGFTRVLEVAFGADLVSREYSRLYEKGGKPYITSACPAVNYYLQKYHHEMLENLTPLVSPMVATAMVAREEYGRDAKVVFIGPCIAKKREAHDLDISGRVDAVLTFQESRRIMAALGIKMEDLKPKSFDPPHPSWGRAYPITGGALRSSGLENNVLDYNVEAIHGRESFLEFIDDFQEGRADCKLVEILFCEGCINGPMMSDGGGQFHRKRKISDFIKQTQRAFNLEEWQYYMNKYYNLDLSRDFQPEKIDVIEPTTEQIREVLNSIKKYSVEDELNCRACGYESCRGLARAICEGLAEKEMCLTYTIDKL
ncbi:MAG: [Fe-Fe] hydrogenase large subunit C-terminal domain-containing protein, partial [Vulcanimicrobiota bacterium]